MYEISIALKYLLPRRRQLSVSIIALVSALVIALVVWLLVVFLSVTEGIERRWVKTLVSLNAPLRIRPTQTLWDSYYYRIDAFSESSDYQLKTLREKLEAAESDPYDPYHDRSLPEEFPLADRYHDGRLKDPVKGVFGAAEELRGFSHVGASDYEVTVANLRLRLLRPNTSGYTQNFLSQMSYLGSFDGENHHVTETLLPLQPADLTHYLELLSLGATNIREEMPLVDVGRSAGTFQQKLLSFFEHVSIRKLEVPQTGWVIPRALWPSQGVAFGIYAEGSRGVFLLSDRRARGGTSFVKLTFTPDGLLVDGHPCALPLLLNEGTALSATLDTSSLRGARCSCDLLFHVRCDLQGLTFEGNVPFGRLRIGDASSEGCFDAEPSCAPPWLYRVGGVHRLPLEEDVGYGVLLASTFRESGVLLGDRGYLSYFASTATSVQEQRIPIYVAGFYDPGLMPVGAKMVLVDRAIAGDIRASLGQVNPSESTGIHVWFDEVHRVDEAKAQLEESLKERGIAAYWKVETYKEFDFARPLVQQFQSDRNLFLLVAVIIIVVACSNIISMLILLVNDKRREIGILRSMGASSRSIGAIFGLCGVFMGLVGSALGIGAAAVTLRYLQRLIAFLSHVQGHEAFNAAFYGAQLPNEISAGVLWFVLLATSCVSVLAGLVPAIKAALLRPSVILRSE